VERGQALGGGLDLQHVVQEPGVPARGRARVLGPLAQLEGPLAQRVGVLGEVPDVPAEQDLHLHLRRGGGPGGGDLHEPHLDEAERGDAAGPLGDGQAHARSSDSSSAAVSSGAPGHRWKTRELASMRTIWNTRSVEAALAKELPTGWSAASSLRPGSTGRSRGSVPTARRNTTARSGTGPVGGSSIRSSAGTRIIPSRSGSRPARSSAFWEVRARGPGLMPTGLRNGTSSPVAGT